MEKMLTGPTKQMSKKKKKIDSKQIRSPKMENGRPQNEWKAQI